MPDEKERKASLVFASPEFSLRSVNDMGSRSPLVIASSTKSRDIGGEAAGTVPARRSI